MWGPSVEDQRGGNVVAYPHHLGAARQELQYPVAQGGVETQGLELDDELGGHYGVKCRAVVDERMVTLQQARGRHHWSSPDHGILELM